MTLQQISQRGKEFLKTAGSLLSAAKTMIDRVISNQLKDVAEDYQRRAEKLRMLRAGHLDPIPRSAGAIGTVLSATFDTTLFWPNFARVFKYLTPGDRKAVAELDVAPSHDPFELRFARRQRRAAQVLTIQIKQIKRDQDDPS